MSSVPETLTELRAENERLRLENARLKAGAAAALAPGAWLDAASDAIIVADRDRRISFWNPAAERLYGWPRAEALGRFTRDIFPALSYPDGSTTESILAALAAKGEWRGTIVQHTRDGREVLVEGSTRPLYDDAGTLTGYVAINRDITAQVQAEAALRESEAKYHALFDRMAQGVIYHAADGSITACNRAAERILGLTLDQMQGRTSLDPRWRCIHEDGSDFPGETHPAMVALRTGEPVHNTLMGVYHWQEQGYRWIMVNAIPQAQPGTAHPSGAFATFDDITERVRIEHDLHSQAQVLDQAQVLVRDARSRITLWTQGDEHLYGYAKAEALGRISHELLQTEFPEPLEQILATLEHSGRWSGKLTHRTRDDQAVVVASQWLLDRAKDDQPARIIESNTDITALERASVRLQVQADASQAFAEAGTSPQAVLDRIALFVAGRLGAGCIIRLLSDDGEWLDPVAVYHPNPSLQAEAAAVYRNDRIATRSADPTAQVLRTGQPLLRTSIRPQEIQPAISPEQWRIFQRFQPHSSVQVVLQARGRPLGTLAFIRMDPALPAFDHDDLRLAQDLADRAALAIENAQLFEKLQAELAERTRSQAALHASEERFRAIIENGVEGIILLGANRHLRYISPTITKLLGYSPAEFALLHSADVCHPDDLALLSAFLKQLGATPNATAQATLRLRHQDGSWRWMQQHGVNQIDNPAIEAIIISLHDVTERVRAQEAFAVEHQRVLQLKNEFMATVSHELRTPLAAVLGHTQLLREGVYGPLAERQQASLERIERSGLNLLALINDILDYSRFEAGQIALTIEPTAVAELCHESVRAIEAAARAKQIIVTTTIDSALTTIQADERRLLQMLSNLLFNAIKFTPLGGDVGLMAQGDAERQQVIFTVWDTGIGIAAEDLGRLFQPFTQLDSKLSRQYEGTGLGLALVRRLAEAHGGGVGVESVLGQGSRFTIALPWSARPAEPLAQAAPAAPAPSSAPAAAPGKAAPTILLVEDHESNVAVLRDILEAQGYRMLVAYTGGDGLAQAREARPDLVLMDIQLPGMSGLEVIQHIRADTQLRAIPIVALTALVMPGDRERCLGAGADDYLAKPVTMHELLKTIERLLARA